ncbi:MAG: tRNA glutamyl-Q(34) synthetase GluQRS [Minwuiales bacterium]|nr:tRNA glutamyl-Q(34) synthetase GluQRS [Minwuiales bacterium]
MQAASDSAFVTRFAPSPTGALHLGHAYSAFVAFDAAQAAGGRFLLRIEDIDTTRCRPEFEAAILEDLAWLGLTWEQPVRRQSDHFDDYRAALDRLAERDLLYPCFCTRKEIQAATAGKPAAPQGPDGPVYPGTCRGMAAAERDRRIAADEPFALRLDADRAARAVGRPLTWTDAEAGEQTCNPAGHGDVVLARKDVPTSYHLSVTVDDALQGVTHVIRGTDLFHATQVHRLLQALLGLPTPAYRHHPLLLDDSGVRLAKRHGSKTLADLRGEGLTPDDVRRRAGL